MASSLLIVYPSIIINSNGFRTRATIKRKSGVVHPCHCSFQPQKDLNTNTIFPKEDLGFMLKLTGGSIGGAAIIKYGSIFFPEITRPDILEALLLVTTPMVVAVVILIKQSSIKTQNPL